ncbi:hypothetical protein L1987_65882 [Smallanthus sonchifolius]|uniref:Uncharacterized protein n=1 Tax=Smallanthus sonchifolius TaxID=185202 RepID=A0ACB9BVU0_9ASTR|nr:hypothetical protein L1987_65882 [Smallanthus sonchifolius]
MQTTGMQKKITQCWLQMAGMQSLATEEGGDGGIQRNNGFRESSDSFFAESAPHKRNLLFLFTCDNLHSGSLHQPPPPLSELSHHKPFVAVGRSRESVFVLLQGNKMGVISVVVVVQGRKRGWLGVVCLSDIGFWW